MKEGRIGCWVVIFFILSLPFFVLYAESDQKKKKEQLVADLSMTKDEASKLKILDELANVVKQTPEEVYYLNRLLDTAGRLDSIKQYYKSLAALGRYYTNEFQLDSIIYYVNIVDSLSQSRKEIPNEYFAVHNYLCRYYLIVQDYELAMNEAVKLQIRAEQSGYMPGQVYSLENLGLIYHVVGRKDEAAQCFEKAISLLKEIEDDPLYRLQLMEPLIRIYLFQKKFEKVEGLLTEYASLIQTLETNKGILPAYYSIDREHFLLNIYSLSLCIGQNEMKQASVVVTEATRLLDQSFDDDALSLYHLTISNYYYKAKDYSLAIEHLENVSNNEYIQDALILKSEIFNAIGKRDSALAVNKRLLDLRKQQNVTAYTQQVDQLRSLRTLNEQELQILQFQTQRQELKNKQSQLIALILLFTILLIFLVFLIRHLIRIRNLKNDLVKEKQSLKTTNENLVVAREKAERADRMKSNFVANMSHEIRTPLNAIVGFSTLLSDSSGEERNEYIQTINNNSDLLLSLVNDVLDLSQMGNDSFVLHFQQVDIHACCSNALNSIHHRINPGVKLKFTHPDMPYITYTAPLRLQQLLVNLLINAAKFTDKGEIHLDYKVDEPAGKITFTVTDTGCGIPLDKQKIIFNRFERVDNIKQGAGLGLSICQAISDRFGGTLYIDSTYTQGSRFVFILPVNEPGTDL